MSFNIRKMNWSKPQPVEGRYFRTIAADKEMIEEWGINKRYLKKKGIGFCKNHGAPYFYMWTDTEGFHGDIEVPKISLLPLPTIETTLGECSLLAPQIPHTQAIVRALRSGNCALDTSDTGVGKTICALVAAWNLGRTPIVICPKSVIGSWEKWAKKTGQTIHVTNYEQVIKDNFPWCRRTGKTKPSYMKFEWDLRSPNEYLVILDEAHRTKGMETLQGAILSATKRAKVKTVALSATLADSPLDLKNAAYCLGLHHWSNWNDWLAHFGCTKIQKKEKMTFNARTKQRCASKSKTDKWVFNPNSSALSKLHKQIFPAMGSRLTIADMKGYFPDNHIIPHQSNIDVMIGNIHAQMQKELDALAAKEKRDCDGKDEGAHLTILIRAQQKVELLKVPVAIEMARDFEAEGNSVMFACQFVETIKAFKKAVGGAEISGSIADKQAEIDKFQSGKEHFISVQSQSGGAGISLHDDVVGMRPRVSIILPIFDARQFKQLLGRAHRAGGKSTVRQYILLDENSRIDMNICKAIERKVNNMAEFNGDDVGIELL